MPASRPAAATSTRIGAQGEILDPIRGGVSTLVACRITVSVAGMAELQAALYDVARWRVDPHGRLLLEGSSHAIVFDEGDQSGDSRRGQPVAGIRFR